MIERSEKGPTLKVLGGISSNSKPELVFLDEGETWTAEIYKTRVLENVVLRWSQRYARGANWIFQQDGAPAHTARSTQEWLENNFPEFIDKKS